MNATDDFYIGWQAKSPLRLGSWMRRVIIALLLLTVGLGVLLALAQRTIGVSIFEWGKVKEFFGILNAEPYPHVLVPRPGTNPDDASMALAYSSYYLVRPFKFGFDPQTASRLNGKQVTLKGTLIYRGNQTMVEVLEDSIKEGPAGHPASIINPPVSLGRQTLVGEIVDSKCYLGVMNPGQLTPHRACAIRCISGGIPPVLLVRQKDGSAFYLLLVSAQGQPVNKQVLNIVAEPVEITGEVVRQGELYMLRAEPATYRRVGG